MKIDVPKELTTRISANNQQYLKEMKTKKQKCQLFGKLDIKGNDYNKRVYSVDDIAPAQAAHSGGNLETKIVEPNVMSPKRTEYGKAIRKQYEQGNIKEQRKNIQQLEPRNDGMSNTLTGVQKDNYVAEPQQEAEFRIRKLTPRECFRLMGVGEPEIDTLTSCGISNTQLYKLAGNSIVVDVLEAIFDKMFVHTEVTEWTLF